MKRGINAAVPQITVGAQGRKKDAKTPHDPLEVKKKKN